MAGTMTQLFHRRRPALPALAVLCVLHGNLALAETADLTELSFESLSTLQVSTASRFLQSVREAPSAVQVIRREDIRRHGWQTLTEALSSLPGFYPLNDGAYDFPGTRGFLIPGDYNTRFLLLVDGQRINDNIYQQALLGEDFPIDLMLVERIEYVPGPGSSIYGGNAIFGVVNVILRKSAELPPLEITAATGSQDYRRLSLTGVHHLPSGAALLASATVGRRGPRDLALDDPTGGLIESDGLPSADGVAHHRGQSRMQRVLLRYEDGGLTLTGRYGERRIQPGTALYNSVFDEPSQYIRDTSWSLGGQYSGALRRDLSVEARLELAHSGYASDSPYLDPVAGLYLNHDGTDGEWWAGDIRLLYTGLPDHKLISGVDARIDRLARQQNHDLGAGVNPVVDIDRREQRAALYLQDEWHLADHWRLNGGWRLDHASGADPVSSPRLGLIWLMDAQHTFKLLAGKAYRPANAYEREYGNGINYLANPQLLPETIRTLEGVMDREFGPARKLRLSVYQYTLSHLISQQSLPGGSLQYQNQDRVRARGLEAVWQQEFRNGAGWQANLGLADTEDPQGRRLSYSPRLIAKLLAHYPLSDHWLLAADASFIERSAYRWQGRDGDIAARGLLNLNLSSQRLPGGFDLHLRILNLLDRRYLLPASGEVPVPTLPGEGRTVEAGVRHAF